MISTPRHAFIMISAIAFAQGGLATPTNAMSMEQLRTSFASPSRDYATAPLWVWNDRLTDEQIRSTLHDLATQDVRQVFVHPRPGLMTPYLSDEWFRLWKIALDEAEKLDMNVWIYEENSYPSGFAGGFVPDAMPESRGRGLVILELDKSPAWTESTLFVYRSGGDQDFEDVSDMVRAGENLPNGKFIHIFTQRAPVEAWTAGKAYVDLLYPGVTEKFIEVTHERYAREIGQHFGKRVPGIFTDEPHLVPAGGFPWTDDLPRAFRERWGYSLTDNLLSLGLPVGDWQRVRHNYFQLLNERFIERWGKPVHDFCAKHGLEFTGHYWEHEWPYCTRTPDNMAMYAWHQRPAIDCLMNRYSEGLHAQFGNVRAVKELSSVANQLGMQRTLCEAYGAAGWDLRFEDMKRIGDWLYVLGVNSMNEHLSFITIRGARKRDHPQSFSYHEPWWDAYHNVATYFTRLSAVMSHGEQVNRVLLIEPTTTCWMYNLGTSEHPHLKRIAVAFENLLRDLEKNQVEYDLGSEDIIRRHGSVDVDEFVTGDRRYELVVIPPYTENLNQRTTELLEAFITSGGTVLCCGDPPTHIEGMRSDVLESLGREAGWETVDPAEVVESALRVSSPGALVRTAEGSQGMLHHHRRRVGQAEIMFLVNTSLEQSAGAVVSGDFRSAEQWDLHTGRTHGIHLRAGQTASATAPPPSYFRVDLQPAGSALYVVSEEYASQRVREEKQAQALAVSPRGGIEVQRLDPNVLAVDYCDVTAGGETRENLYTVSAGHFVFSKHGFDRNPWDRAVQFKDELISKTFPDDSGFEATYRFTIRDKVPTSLEIVIERAEAYEITCNGKPVKHEPGQWWLDKSFGRIDIRDAARVGENAVTIKARPFEVFMELEAAYVIGDFALVPAEKGFVMAPPEPLELGPWNEQGLPLYGHRVAYRQSFDVGDRSSRLIVELPGEWLGSVAEVRVNGKAAGHIWYQPWELDVTEHVTEGTNDVEVIVTGTLKNTLGPHHGNPLLGLAWPGMWDQAPADGPPPGKDYSTIGYGLFKPFRLVAKRAP